MPPATITPEHRRLRRIAIYIWAGLLPVSALVAFSVWWGDAPSQLIFGFLVTHWVLSLTAGLAAFGFGYGYSLLRWTTRSTAANNAIGIGAFLGVLSFGMAPLLVIVMELLGI